MGQGMSVYYFCLFGAGLYAAKRLSHPIRSAPLPPGPTGLPVIGNLFLMPSNLTWEHFAALGKKHGDIFYMSILGKGYVILNSSKAISDILHKQSNKCSERPHAVMGDDLVGFGNALLFLKYGDRFRQTRKLFSRLFGNRSSTAAFNSIQVEETRRFLRNVLRTPEDLKGHIHSQSGAVILKIAYGYTAQDGTDQFVILGQKAMELVTLVSAPSGFLVNLIPALQYLPEWFPGMEFLQDAKKYRQLVTESLQRPYQYVVEQMAAGTAIRSFASTILEGGIGPEEEEILMWACYSAYLGASDTTVSAIYAFFLAMVLFPDVRAKAQAEIDAVVGSERLPCFDDQDSLPYTNALCKEVLRWHAVAPLGAMHVANEDIYSNGFLIPKGTQILGNAGGVLHDESIYPEPDIFRPERFLGDMPEPDPQNVCFGFGRRICPGLHLAEASIFLLVVKSLAVFDISKPVVNGIQVTPEFQVTSGGLSYVKPFKCQITARSARAEALVHG